MASQTAIEATGLEKSYGAVRVLAGVDLPYLSSAFVPVDTMPTWIHGFANNQPVTPVIETLRGLLLEGPVGSSPWLALAWCGGITVASVALSGVLFRRRTA